MSLIVSRFRFLKSDQGHPSCTEIILPGMQIFKVVSWIPDCSHFCFLFGHFWNTNLNNSIIEIQQTELKFCKNRQALSNYTQRNRSSRQRQDNTAGRTEVLQEPQHQPHPNTNLKQPKFTSTNQQSTTTTTPTLLMKRL